MKDMLMGVVMWIGLMSFIAVMVGSHWLTVDACIDTGNHPVSCIMSLS